MIYLDTSVVLAHLFAEDRLPPVDLWRQHLVASQLLRYETWNRVHARGLSESHGDAVRGVLERLAYVPLSPTVLSRALEPFPVSISTLDALHVASMVFLRDQGQRVELASYDRRQLEVARALGLDCLTL